MRAPEDPFNIVTPFSMRSIAPSRIAAMGVLLVWRHSANISKLLAGKEGKLGQKAAPHAAIAAHDPHAGHAKPHHHKHGKH